MILTYEQIIAQVHDSNFKYYEESPPSIPVKKIVYKYRNWLKSGTFDDTVLTKQVLHFSVPETFDDKKDCRNLVDYEILNEDSALREKFKIHLAVTHFMDNNLILNIDKIKKYCLDNFNRKDFSSIVIDDFLKKEWFEYCSLVGILSLSKNNKSEKMWKEYANNYTGVCYAFDTVTLMVDLKTQGIINGADVLYENELPQLSVLSSSTEKTEIRKYIKLRELYKFEDEFRLCLNKKGLTIESRNLKYGLGCLERIIFGHNMSKVNFDQFIFILDKKKKGKEIPLYRTVISNGVVEILRLNEGLYWN